MKYRLLLFLGTAVTTLLHGTNAKSLPEILSEYHKSAEKQKGWSELSYAIKKGYLTAAETMIRNGVDSNQPSDDESETPFTVAIECGYPALVKQMIDYKADVNYPVKNVFDTCMPQMYSESYPERACGPDVYAPLMVAIKMHQPEIAALLLEGGANPSYRSQLLYQPIHLAVRHQQADTLQRLLNKGADVNSKDMWGYTPLHYCAFLPDSPTVARIGRLLLERNADAMMPTDSAAYRLTPMHLAAMNGHGDLIQLLLARGAEVDALDGQGATPLWRAATSPFENRDVVRGLIQAYANVNKLNTAAPAQDPNSLLGSSILAAAISSHNLDTAELLLQNGANANLVDAHGKTPLMYAVANNDADAVILLLRFKADPNHAGQLGRTAMEMAHNLEHAEIFTLLVNAHAEQLYK